MKMELTPKEKAQELIGKCLDIFINDKDEHYTETAWRLSKQCALTAVDEILNNFGLTANGQTFFTEHRAVQYYQEVKQEIEKL
jgi:hypothetical protein